MEVEITEVWNVVVVVEVEITKVWNAIASSITSSVVVGCCVSGTTTRSITNFIVGATTSLIVVGWCVSCSGANPCIARFGITYVGFNCNMGGDLNGKVAIGVAVLRMNVLAQYRFHSHLFVGIIAEDFAFQLLIHPND